MIRQDDHSAVLLNLKPPQRAHLPFSEHDAAPSARDMFAHAAGHVPNRTASTNTSPTLVRSSSNDSINDPSPTLKSIFPSYDPTLPLPYQSYSHNARSAKEPRQGGIPGPERKEYSPSLYSRSCSTVTKQPHVLAALSTPSQTCDSTIVSTPQELLDLWALANGEDVRYALPVFHLALLWSVYMKWSKVLFIKLVTNVPQP